MRPALVKRPYITILLAALIPILTALAQDRPPNWTGNFEPCARSGELLKSDHMDLNIRIRSADPALAAAFERALDFWAGILDMSWGLDETAPCSIQMVIGTTKLFHSAALVARAQFADRDNFQGWIAFSSQASRKLTRAELYLTCIHELGHMFGLKHNPNPKSLMYFMDLEGSETLDASDLSALAARHRLRDDTYPQKPLPTF